MKVNGKRRILEVLARLENGEGVNKEEMAQEYGVSTRSIQRDLSEIDEVLSNPYFGESGKVAVKYNRDNKKHYLSRENAEILSSEERLAICKILLGSKVLSKKQVENIVNKLVKRDSKSEEFVGAQEMRNELEHYKGTLEDEDISKLWKLEQAVQEQHYISIDVQAENGKYYTAQLVPKGILFLGQDFYLVASKEAKDSSLGTYRIGDIKEIRSLEKSFKVDYAQRFEAGKFRKEWECKNTKQAEYISSLEKCA